MFWQIPDILFYNSIFVFVGSKQQVDCIDDKVSCKEKDSPERLCQEGVSKLRESAVKTGKSTRKDGGSFTKNDADRETDRKQKMTNRSTATGFCFDRCSIHKNAVNSSIIPHSLFGTYRAIRLYKRAGLLRSTSWRAWLASWRLVMAATKEWVSCGGLAAGDSKNRFKCRYATMIFARRATEYVIGVWWYDGGPFRHQGKGNELAILSSYDWHLSTTNSGACCCCGTFPVVPVYDSTLSTSPSHDKRQWHGPQRE